MSYRYEGYVILITVIAQLASIGFVSSISSLFGSVTFEPVKGADLLNALIFVLLPALGTILYLRLRKHRSAKTLYAAAEAFLIFILTSLILGYQSIPYYLALVLSIVVSSFAYLVIFKGSVISKTILAILVSSESGAFLGVVFTPPTLYLVLLFFAVYDVIAVFKGPLKKVIDEPGFGMLSMDIGKISMGLGDQIFYSMVPAAAFLLKGLLYSIIAMFVVDAGVLLTMLLLRKRRALPGLTIPLLLSLLLFFLPLPSLPLPASLVLLPSLLLQQASLGLRLACLYSSEVFQPRYHL